MTTQQSPVILYTPNAYKGSVGVLSTNVNGEEMLAIVEVLQMAGKSVYQYKFDGGTSNGLNRVDAHDVWKLAAESYGAMLSEVDKKFMNTHFKEVLKPYEDKRKEERKIAREAKVLREKIKNGEEV